jgi:hypothetical protein
MTKPTPDLRTLPKSKRPPPSTGQSAPKKTIPWADLSAFQQRVARAVRELAPCSAQDVATKLQVDSLQVRNALRPLVQARYVKRGKGGYVAGVAGEIAVKYTKPAKAKTTHKAVEKTDSLKEWALARAVVDLKTCSDSKLAKATTLSRGFCIPRLKRVKALNLDLATTPVEKIVDAMRGAS